ncbi:MAG: GntR family transcriptional regulator [Armatimonadota bacterium]|nr:GntR family transcriptional regulator [Armatimonadota bacterium]
MIIEIDFRSEVPPARQIADAVTLRALTGALAPGSPLPDVRELSLQLQVNPRTVEQAYRVLVEAGIAARQAGGEQLRIARDLPPAEEAGGAPIRRAMRSVLERAGRMGLSREMLQRTFRDLLEGYDAER